MFDFINSKNRIPDKEWETLKNNIRDYDPTQDPDKTLLVEYENKTKEMTEARDKSVSNAIKYCHFFCTPVFIMKSIIVPYSRTSIKHLSSCSIPQWYQYLGEDT